MDSTKKCVFCDSEWGIDEAHDEQGKPFTHCGWCWAHVLRGGFMPLDIDQLIVTTRRWLLNERPAQEVK